MCFSQFPILRSESSRPSQAFPRTEVAPLKGQKSPLLAGFCNSAAFSELPNLQTERPIRQKSPVTTANIPVFGRLARETGFDPHCVLRLSGCRALAEQDHWVSISHLAPLWG